MFSEEYEITITLREIKVLFCCSPLGSIVQYCFGSRPNWYVWAKLTPLPETSWLHVHYNWIWNSCPRLFVFCSWVVYKQHQEYNPNPSLSSVCHIRMPYSHNCLKSIVTSTVKHVQAFLHFSSVAAVVRDRKWRHLS